MSSPLTPPAADVNDLRARFYEYASRGVQVLMAVIAFFAVTMLADIRGELRTLTATLQDLVVRTAGIEQRVGALEGGQREDRERLDRMDTDWRDFWREHGPLLRSIR